MKNVYSKAKIVCICTILFLIVGSNQASIIAEKTGITNMNSEWVVMFYQNGDNKLSPYIDVCLDLIETVGATDDVKIAVLIDKKPLNDTKLYYYDGKTAVEQEWPLESDMSDPETLVQFAEKVMNDYPANHYCLEITANKGSGWQGVCWDEHGDGIMITMPEIYDALDEITENGCFKLDVLLIQTCLGGNLEFQYQVRQFCDYYVGYADCGLVGDIPFDGILADLVEYPSMTSENLATTIVDHFTPQQIQNIYQAMGAIDSLMLDELATGIDDLALFLIDNIDPYKDDIQLALEDARKYGLQFNIDYYIDLVDFLEHLSINDPDFNGIKNDVLNKVENAVVSKVALEGYPSCGFNFYFPNNKDDYNDALRYDHALPSPYEETLFAIDTNWDEFLKIYLEIPNNAAPNPPTISGPNKGKANEEYDFILSATDPQEDDVTFYIEWGDSTYEMTDSVSSGDEVTIGHTWDTEGTYEIKAKSIDQYGAESDWTTLEVSMPKRKTSNNPLSAAILIGKITDIEYQDGSFRFLPEKIMYIGYHVDQGPIIQILDETFGGFPCCNYIDLVNFHGITTSKFICGIWSIV